MTEWKAGMKVFINPKCPKTAGTVSTNSRMENMMGQIHKIHAIRDSETVYIGSWIWHVDDIKIPTKKKHIEPELFDPNNLIR